MTATFEELDSQPTRMGDISLRRRVEPTLGVEVFEVKLGEEFLMSSLFTVAERALATLAFAELDDDDDGFHHDDRPLDVVVGGLGLGYTAQAALADDRVGRLTVIEALAPVIDWHHRRLVPVATDLVTDPRCHLVEGDFFALIQEPALVPGETDATLDAILVDIDHTPRHVLDPSHLPFYEAEGLASVRAHLAPGGIFGLWSDAAPDAEFLEVARQVFASCAAHVVTFANFYTGAESSNTVYVAKVDR